jgi:hypothetical protein
MGQLPVPASGSLCGAGPGFSCGPLVPCTPSLTPASPTPWPCATLAPLAGTCQSPSSGRPRRHAIRASPSPGSGPAGAPLANALVSCKALMSCKVSERAGRRPPQAGPKLGPGCHGHCRLLYYAPCDRARVRVSKDLEISEFGQKTIKLIPNTGLLSGRELTFSPQFAATFILIKIFLLLHHKMRAHHCELLAYWDPMQAGYQDIVHICEVARLKIVAWECQKDFYDPERASTANQNMYTEIDIKHHISPMPPPQRFNRRSRSWLAG